MEQRERAQNTALKAELNKKTREQKKQKRVFLQE